jgi:hypothetical protein
MTPSSRRGAFSSGDPLGDENAPGGLSCCVSDGGLAEVND